MFCGIVANENLNRVQRRALRAVYNDYSSGRNELLVKWNHPTIHDRNLKFLIIEVFKCLNNESPPLLNGLFQVKNNTYDLRINNLLILPNVSTQTYGTHSLKYRGSSTWNYVPDDLKDANDSLVLKDKLKTITFAHCTCKICA